MYSVLSTKNRQPQSQFPFPKTQLLIVLSRRLTKRTCEDACVYGWRFSFTVSSARAAPTCSTATGSRRPATAVRNRRPTSVIVTSYWPVYDSWHAPPAACSCTRTTERLVSASCRAATGSPISSCKFAINRSIYCCFV